MKKIILIIVFAGSAITTFSQQIDTSYMKYMKQDLIRRSANNKKAGWILLGASGCMMAGGFVGLFNSKGDGLYTSSALIGFGMMSALTSIPLFVISGSQSIRAARINAHIKLENHFQTEGSSMMRSIPMSNSYSTGIRQTRVSQEISFFPAISLKMDIGR